MSRHIFYDAEPHQCPLRQYEVALTASTFSMDTRSERLKDDLRDKTAALHIDLNCLTHEATHMNGKPGKVISKNRLPRALKVDPSFVPSPGHTFKAWRACISLGRLKMRSFGTRKSRLQQCSLEVALRHALDAASESAEFLEALSSFPVQLGIESGFILPESEEIVFLDTLMPGLVRGTGPRRELFVDRCLDTGDPFAERSIADEPRRVLEAEQSSVVPGAVLAILVPFREDEWNSRQPQLQAFVRHFQTQFLPAVPSDVEACVMILEQVQDGSNFNRGKLLNVGARWCRSRLCSDKDIILCLHDVDMLPDPSLIPFYCHCKQGELVTLQSRTQLSYDLCRVAVENP
ncbi:unnamed protein product [Polarella glacialis]|uniref:Galactosyltransferase N-terminal domain-containing protein n=1 Tax=Polarella glacialis TaxID=89957 RepID=A0A813LWG8_POLGL|nr:unnamed protein product [Polarella glacialis]